MATAEGLVALEARLERAIDRFDGLLLALCAAQHLLMIAGFTMVQAGVVEPKNVTSVLVKSVFDTTITSLSWWLVGYALAFGSTEGGFIGKDAGNFALRDVRLGNDGWNRFLWTFGAVAVSNTVFGRAACSERATLLPSMLFTFLSASFIYPVLVHWTWGQGWLSAWGAMPTASGEFRPIFSGSQDANGMIDGSGAGVVHLAGACMALMGTLIIGPRTGRFVVGVRSDEAEYGNKTLQYLGLLLVWCSSYAVYLGPNIMLHSADIAGKAVINITVSAAGSCLACTLLCGAVENSIDITVVLNSILSGLVAVSGNLGVILPWHAFCTGFGGGVFSYSGRLLLWRLMIDDPCDAISIHGFSGLWALWAVGLFCTDENVSAAGHLNSNKQCNSGEQFAVQFVGSLAIISWACSTSGFVLGTMRVCGLDLRVCEEIEEQGLDVLFGAPLSDAQNEDTGDKETSSAPTYHPAPTWHVAPVDEIGQTVALHPVAHHHPSWGQVDAAGAAENSNNQAGWDAAGANTELALSSVPPLATSQPEHLPNGDNGSSVLPAGLQVPAPAPDMQQYQLQQPAQSQPMQQQPGTFAHHMASYHQQGLAMPPIAPQPARDVQQPSATPLPTTFPHAAAPPMHHAHGMPGSAGYGTGAGPLLSYA